MSKPDGGPAFPQPAPLVATGMTLRDYFAAAAMARMLPWNHEYPTEEVAARQSADFSRLTKMISTSAYLLADAMLAERSK